MLLYPYVWLCLDELCFDEDITLYLVVGGFDENKIRFEINDLFKICEEKEVSNKISENKSRQREITKNKKT